MENKNQPANPATIHKAKGDDIETVSFPGLTKREYVATITMQGLLAANNGQSLGYLAKSAVIAADELLKQLES